jgi:hypothetical protein
MDNKNPDPEGEIYRRLMKWTSEQEIARASQLPGRHTSVSCIDETIEFLAREFGRKIPSEEPPDIHI